MSQVEELLKQQIDQVAAQAAHDIEAARNEEKASHLSSLRAAENRKLELENSIRDTREDVTETFFKFATNSMQALATSPIASHGLKYFTPVFGAVGLIYTAFKKGRLVDAFAETAKNTDEAIEVTTKKLADMGFGPDGKPLESKDTITPPPGSPLAPRILTIG